MIHTRRIRRHPPRAELQHTWLLACSAPRHQSRITGRYKAVIRKTLKVLQSVRGT